MNVGIIFDNTIPLQSDVIAKFFSDNAPNIAMEKIEVMIRFRGEAIDYDREYEKIAIACRDKIEKKDIVFIVTAVPFTNNFFYIGTDKIFIISLSGWNQLTALPMSNGIVYLIAQIIVKYYLEIGRNHDLNTGCINDYMWDKSIVDAGMRAASLCGICMMEGKNTHRIGESDFKSVELILNLISSSSRKGADILQEKAQSIGLRSSAHEENYVFLCHNSIDKPNVRMLNEKLKYKKITTWLDEERILPGDIWQDKLELALGSVSVCLIIVGDSGAGPWQNMERRALISECADRGCKIIPILIGNQSSVPVLPIFLRQFMWLDLRTDWERGFSRLLATLQI